MDTIIYVCMGNNREYLGTFTSRQAAESSWKMSYMDSGKEITFATEAGYWQVSADGKPVGKILCEVCQSKAVHL